MGGSSCTRPPPTSMGTWAGSSTDFPALMKCRCECVLFRSARRRYSFSPSLLERQAARHLPDERLEAIPGSGGLTGNFPNRRLVVRLEAAAERVGQKLLGQQPREVRQHLAQHIAHFGRRRERLAARQHAARVDWELAVLRAPLADGIVVLQREPQWIHARMTGRADGIVPVI